MLENYHGQNISKQAATKYCTTVVWTWTLQILW